VTTAEPTHYGRSEEEWDRLTDEGLAFLIERARLRKVTSYTEMNTTLARRTGLRSFDFERADERAAMGHLLGLIVERNLPTTELMISALVHYLDQNDAGPGFYVLAQHGSAAGLVDISFERICLSGRMEPCPSGSRRSSSGTS